MCKTEHKHQSCLTCIDTPRTKVKESILVKLADSGTVAALNIISKDLELRLGIHAGIFGEKDIVVALVCICPLGSLPHQNTSVKGAGGAVIQNSLEELGAVAIWCGMINIDKIGYVLCLSARKSP